MNFKIPTERVNYAVCFFLQRVKKKPTSRNLPKHQDAPGPPHVGSWRNPLTRVSRRNRINDIQV